MHPWMTQRMAQDRRRELARIASPLLASHETPRRRVVGAHAVNRRATRVLGELLIRTGWRLVGPDGPPSGVRPRLALRGSAGVTFDSG